MQHELPFYFAFVALHALRVIGGAKRRCNQRLGLATGEQRRTVNARQHANFNRDCTNLVKRTVIRANTIVQHLLTEDLLAQKLVVLRKLLRSSWIIGRKLLLQRVLDLLDQGVALELRMLLGVERVLQLRANLRQKLIHVNLIEFDRRRYALRLACTSNEVFDARADLLDLNVGKFNCVDNLLFGALLRAGLDHHNAVLGADDHDVQGADRALCVGRVDDEAAINQANAHRTHGTVKRNIRQRQSAARAIHAEHVWIILLIRRVNERDDLGFVAERLGEQWADRPVDLAAGEDFLLAGTAFPLDEAAGDASACVGVFAVFNR